VARDDLVSIIIDNYNYGRFVGAAIESALAQTHPACEVIVVDDGSTDDSADVISRYGRDVRVLLKENGGQASAFNQGFAESSGAVVLFLDADDMLLPDAAARVMSVFGERPGVAKVQYRLRVVDENGVPSGGVVPPAHVRMPSGDLRRYLTRCNFTWWSPTTGQAFRADVLRGLFPLPEPVLRNGVDYYLQPSVAMLGEIVSLDEVGGLYRQHGANDALRTELDLDNIRSFVVRARDVHPHIVRVAARSGLVGYPSDVRELLDVIILSERMISRKLEPGRHPIAGDPVHRIARLGVVSALTRPDVDLRIRVLHAAWFVAMLVAPRRIAAEMAPKLLYPATRGRWSVMLRRLRGSRLRQT
jgi:glycosyltransferase involved in cell wall biosynthesis